MVATERSTLTQARACLLLLLAFALTTPLSLPAYPQSAAAVDTSFSLAVNRPVLCRRVLRVNADVVVEVGGIEQRASFQVEDERVFVDHHTVLTREREEVTRTFVKAFQTLNGAVKDPALNGVRLVYQRQGERMEMRLAGDRVLPQATVDSLLESRFSVGLWLDLPQVARPGQTYRVDMTYLASVLLKGDDPVQAPQAKFEFLGYDASTGVASFKGSVRLVESGEDDGMHFVATYDLTGDLRVQPAERRVLSLQLKGRVRVKGEGRGPGRGNPKLRATGTCEIDFTTAIGDAVSKALQGRAQFRPNKVEFSKLDVGCAVPSYYQQLPTEVLPNALLRTIEGSKGKAFIQAGIANGDTENPKTQLAEVATETSKAHPDLKTKSVSSRLGQGQAFTFSREREDGSPETVRAEWYPYRDGVYFIFQFSADPKIFRDVLKEFAAARRTLYRISARASKE